MLPQRVTANSGKISLEQRWLTLCDRIADRPFFRAANTLYLILQALYAYPSNRTYHTWDHVSSCLVELDRVRHKADNSDALEFALFHHDSIYVPGANDNEGCSVRVARICSQSLCLSPSIDLAVVENIEVTAGLFEPTWNDGQLMQDIDHSVLAWPTDDYMIYSQKIRDEYADVPEELFRDKRRQFLDGMLKRNSVFYHQDVYAEAETQAQENMIAELGRLDGNLDSIGEQL